MSTLHDDAKATVELLRALTPLFIGKPPQVQGAALADLLAMWLAGHVVRGDEKATKRIREHMLTQHLKAVRALIPVNFDAAVAPQLKKMTQ